MISDALRRLAAAVGAPVPPAPKPVHRDPKTSKRTAVLRPQDPKLALRRLAEWEAIMDKALDAPALDKRKADELWLTMKREQSWTFLGWLGADAKTITADDGTTTEAAPGDLHELEDRLSGWR